MTLDRANLKTHLLNARDAFEDIAPSVLLSHESACCSTAQSWFLAMHRSFVTTPCKTHSSPPFAAPSWMARFFKWGASSWPMYWCEAMSREMFDCGVFAALAREAFMSQGVRVYAAQLIQLELPANVHTWRATWTEAGCDVKWLYAPFSYHEAVAIEYQGQVNIYDSTTHLWLQPHSPPTPTNVFAVRVIVHEGFSDVNWQWGSHTLTANRWNMDIHHLIGD